ncbi:hypothetical protein MTX78_21945 [Hymenobacter tibetensis]|uniref:Heavy metal binding domain-containing protein n=1 Tax=Hymenobacter tibetensis TaxID=497967 RepID=A0ABY4CWW0_9BACT|nr:heavy metal-binding domain-containing protein [Hymenobacter tibetensis]UOG74766.1 hypothetical protein MTX78_21945 [Hymenobacter tibetensis]
MRGLSLTRIAGALLLASSLWLSVACESKPAASTATSAATTGGEDQPVAAAYICPMGCEGSASNQPGKCPVCEMTLEPNPDYKPAAQ